MRGASERRMGGGAAYAFEDMVQADGGTEQVGDE